MPPAKPSRRATLKDVAAALGVSPATVSNAYNRPDQLSQELRERILAAAHELGYPGPDPLARSLRRGQTGTLGVVYGDRLTYAFEDPAAALFLQGVASATEQAGLNLLLLPAPQDEAIVANAAVDGFIIYCLPERTSVLRAALARGLPCVLVDQLDPDGQPSVSIDDAGGAREACEHLLTLGHRRIGVLALELSHPRQRGAITPEREAAGNIRPTVERLRGYRDAVHAAGLRWDTVAVPVEIDENTIQEGEDLTRELLVRPDAPTAILAMSDQLAIGALRAAQALGLRVPEDLSVVGYDDVPAAAQIGLTTVHQPTRDKGRLAGELLLGALRGEQDGASMRLPTRLTVRATSGPRP